MPGTYLAFDDTDSPEGMCTTYLAALVLDELEGFDLIGLPRIVRLNPNIPWKTRGNAAICLSFGKGLGKARVCGALDGKEVKCYERGNPADPAEVLSGAADVLERYAIFDCENTNPGIVACNLRPPPSLYWGAVRGILKLEDVERTLSSCGAVWKKYGIGRGVIGAASAISWRPRDRTWEVIAYRSPDRFGTLRNIDPESVIQMDKATKYTFNNYDYENDHVAIAPGSPCPILFGIRGDSADELLEARRMLRGEKSAKWLLFLTNQATEEHVVPKRIGQLAPRDSVRVNAKVVRNPVTIPGGHVLVRLSDGDAIDAVFYEPSRSFRDVARALIPGDEITAIGSVRGEPRGLNVEKLAVSTLAKDLRKIGNPTCVVCSKRMGSMGTGQGFRCKRCGAKLPSVAAEVREVPRAIQPGWYEPPVASRRHLHKPIRRMSMHNINKI